MLFEPGEVAEWFMAAVLKTVERKFRGFESLPLRQSGSIDYERAHASS